MLKLAADENFNRKIVEGLLRRMPDLDIVRVQDAGMAGSDDDEVLDWATAQNRILLTHDRRTMTRTARDRIRSGRAMPGLIEISGNLPIGTAVEEMHVLVHCSLPNEWENQIRFLPLQ